MRRRITVRVKANSKQTSVENSGDNIYTVRVKAPAIEGKANEAVIELLSEYFGRPKRNVVISKGARSKIKLVDIL